MNDSLSILVPVRNAEAIIGEQVAGLLDVLPDLTSRFEILVIDDGSTDHTVDLVRDLASQYPQVRLIRHVGPQGVVSAIKTGLAWARGETVLVQEDVRPPSAASLRRLWALRHERDVVLARPARRPGVFDAELIDRLVSWGQALRHLAATGSGGMHLIRREGAEALAAEELHERALSPQQPLVGGAATEARHRRGTVLLGHLKDSPA